MIPDTGGDDAVVACHASHLAQTRHGIRHEVDDELRESCVERTVGEGQLLRRRSLHGDTRMTFARGLDERVRGIHSRHGGRVEQLDQMRRQRPRTASDVDDALAGGHACEIGECGSQRNRVAAHEAVIGVGGDGERHGDNLRGAERAGR